MTLVLIPGFMLDQEMWSRITPAMSAFGPIHHVPLDRGASIEEMADLAIEALPDNFILIGFSLGGYVAREIARRAPDRVSALILIATSARADTPEQAHRKDVALQLAQEPFKGLSRSAIAASLHHERRTDQKLIDDIRHMGARLGMDAFRRQSALARNGDLDRLSEITCPTLVIAAQDDDLRSMAEARELTEGIPDTELKSILNSGHMVPLEQPDLLASAIATWLSARRLSV